MNRLLLYTLTSSLIKYNGASKAYAMLSGQVSEIFSTSIRVKQGGPLSPRLFSLYIEEVLTLLDDSGHGIKIGNIVVNILLYADDIVLFANNKHEMMIHIIEKFDPG